MSDLLTHWAVFDDCRRLLAHDPQAEPTLNRVLHEYAEFARLGSIARRGSQWMPFLLRRASENRETLSHDERARQKLAFALGGILHFPADFVLKPMMSELARSDWNRAHHEMQHGQDKPPHREVSAYFDCHVWKKVYLEGREEPFSRFLLADNETEPGQALEAFVRALFQRALLSSHTLSPDRDDPEAWLDALFDQVQPLYIDIGLYVRVFQNPDPAKIAAYRVETGFYRDDDPLIRLARALHRNERDGDALAPHALDETLHAPNHSAYARCLQLGIEKMRKAGEFWRGERLEPPDVLQGRIAMRP